MVIVTQNQYILASKINHITMDEQHQYIEVRHKNGRTTTVLDKYFQITVIYTPETSQGGNAFSSSSRSDETRECSVIIRGPHSAHLVFKNLIQQIREQMPDQLYLDTALERMLTGVDAESLKDKEAGEGDYTLDLEMKDDRSTKKIRSSGKTKRASKKVLRGAKRKR